MIYLKLFLAFFKIGLFAIGGGLATLPFLYEISHTHGWFSQQMVADMLAVSESTPGPIGVNMATFAGFTTAGIPGAIVATASLVLPSLLIILVLASVISRFQENRYVRAAFSGLRPAVVALITVAFWQVLKASVLHPDAFLESRKLLELFDPAALLLMAVLYAVMHFFKKLHPAVLILMGAAAGILFRL